MAAKMTQYSLVGLTPKHANFVIEYLKDFDAQRAAEAAGYSRSSAPDILKRPDVAAAIDRVLEKRLENSDINAEWALMEAVDNHRIARQAGKYSASNTALGMIMRHRAVDAMSAERVEIASDEEIRNRLLRGRQRAEKPKLSFI